MAKNSTTTPYGLRLPKKGKTWVYDFELEGVRYTRSTRQSDFKKAVAVAAKVHAEILAGESSITRVRQKPEMPLREVMGRFYKEKGEHEANAKTVLGQLNRLATELGPDVLLSRITTDDILRYQTMRRKQVSNRTVNAEVPELLRRVIKWSRLWGINRGSLGEPDFDWSPFKLTIPAHRTRAASREEQAKLLWSLRKDYRPIILFALKTGLRKKALLVERSQIDWAAETLFYQKKSKRTNDTGWLPLTPRLLRLLGNEIRKAPEEESVFTYINQKEGGRKPITASGLRMIMQRAVKKAGLKDWRLIHDLRHTAATETLRASQNLAAVQHMLGHSDIGQTSRYAHVLMDDVRSAMARRR